MTPNMIAARLSQPQISIITRQCIHIGNPERLVPVDHPQVHDRSWQALRRKGLLHHDRFGFELTPLGIAVRAALDAVVKTEV